jgi:hypothetical protein
MPNTIEFQFLIFKKILDFFPFQPFSNFRPQGPKHHKVCIPFIYLPILEREKVCVPFCLSSNFRKKKGVYLFIYLQILEREKVCISLSIFQF